ncbi:MAG: phage holin family protein [Vicinamibacterales bacterium]
MAEARTISNVLQDILRNLQDMVRSEIRLARVEIRDEIGQTLSSGVWIAAGAISAVSAWIFLLWTLVYALATRMPLWAATLVVAVVMAGAAAVLVRVGIQKIKRVQPIPARTVESLKENLEWMKQQTR